MNHGRAEGESQGGEEEAPENTSASYGRRVRMPAGHPENGEADVRLIETRVADLVNDAVGDSLAAVRPALLAEIEKDHPGIDPAGSICPKDLTDFRAHHIQSLLISEKGEIRELKQAVIDSMKSNELMSSEITPGLEESYTFGQWLADHIATFGGSWTFMMIFFLFLLVWIGINVLALQRVPFDPYPFILLNLILSCLAAIQAPVIMMSQNRQEEKVDHLLMQQWERLVEIQQVQIELLQELKGDQQPPDV